MTRAFIVGNGPSLNQTNLELLNTEISFGCNAIDLLYDKTQWRPTYYVAHDAHGVEHKVFKERISKHVNEGNSYGLFWREQVVCSSDDFIPRVPLSYKYYDPCKDHPFDMIAKLPAKWHLPVICGWPSTLHVAMQHAVLMNHNPLILIGCDLGAEHFTDDYPSWLTKEDDHKLIQGHAVAKASCEELGVDILNATIGGNLEVYERVNYESLF